MRRLLPALSLATAALLAGCQQSNFFGVRQPVVQAYLSVYAASRVPSYFPSAIAIGGPTVTATRADITLSGGAFYDLVLDLDTSVPATPRVRLIPIRAWAQAPTLSFPQVALRVTDDDFLRASRPPDGNYRVDSVTVVRPGQTVYLQTNRCAGGFTFSQEQWSKVVVDSIDVAQGLVLLRLATDQNCGQREFPTSDFPRR